MKGPKFQKAIILHSPQYLFLKRTKVYFLNGGIRLAIRASLVSLQISEK